MIREIVEKIEEASFSVEQPFSKLKDLFNTVYSKLKGRNKDVIKDMIYDIDQLLQFESKQEGFFGFGKKKIKTPKYSITKDSDLEKDLDYLNGLVHSLEKEFSRDQDIMDVLSDFDVMLSRLSADIK